MIFKPSKEMKIELTDAQAQMLSTKETIKEIIKKNPDTVLAYDIYKEDMLIGFVLVHEFDKQKYFLWEYAIDVKYQGSHNGTKALIEFIDYLQNNYGAKEITTTYLFGNSVAKHLYEKIGFMETSVVDEENCHEVNMAYYIK